MTRIENIELNARMTNNEKALPLARALLAAAAEQEAAWEEFELAVEIVRYIHRDYCSSLRCEALAGFKDTTLESLEESFRLFLRRRMGDPD